MILYILYFFVVVPSLDVTKVLEESGSSSSI